MTLPAPYPWTAEPSMPSDGVDAFIIRDAAGREIAWVNGPQLGDAPRAVAAVMAAAPELLEALRGMIGAFVDPASGQVDRNLAAKDAHAAIAAATSQPSGQ